MTGDGPSLAELEKLCESSEISDRAFAYGVIRLGRRGEEAARLLELVRQTALEQHRSVRDQIRSGTLDRRAFVAELLATPIDAREHLIEEILDVAYPPLDEAVEKELVFDAPSGLGEILFAIENADLDPTRTVVDLGSGMGKVILLVAVLTGARCIGLELDDRFLTRAKTAAESLLLSNVQLVSADLRQIDLPEADVYYMYIPLLRPGELTTKLAAIAARRSFRLFSQTLDTELGWLRATEKRSYWLTMYELSSAG